MTALPGWTPNELAEVDSEAVPASLAETLDALVGHLRTYVYFTDPLHAAAVALWVAHTYVTDRCEQSPILAFMSAVRRSGKSKAIDVITPVVNRPWHAIRPSEAVFFRRIDRDHPTVLLDEVDTIFNAKTEHEGIRACLNGGNRPGATVPRAVAKGKGFDLVDFKIYCPKVLAGIGQMPETVADRAIVIPMSRKGPGDQIERLRMRDAIRLGEPIGEALAANLSQTGHLTLGNDELPIELDDRAQDSWEPLLAIAKLAGGTWPERARAAAVALAIDRSDVDDESLGIVLLRDMRTALGEPGTTLTTSQLIESLCNIELAPWNDLKGRTITGRRLARLLRPFGIRPERERSGSCYRWGQFVDAWSRYLPPETAATAATATKGSPAVAPAALVALPWEEGGDDEPIEVHGWPPPEPSDIDPPSAWSEVMQ